MILHFLFNTFVVFLVLALFIECILWIFRIHNPRLRYFCRLLPLAKIPFDFIVFFFVGSSLFFNLNPFSCEVYTSDFVASLFHIERSLQSHLILPQYIASLIPTWGLNFISIIAVTVAVLGICRKTFQLIVSLRGRKKLIAKATLLHSSDVDILISEVINAPCATGNKTILLPTKLLEAFSDKELEAVIAHEREHLKWKDPLFKLIVSFICAFCWWIPTKWWLNRLFLDQEQACDIKAKDRHALAEALLKTAKFSKQLEPIVTFFNSVKRMRCLLHVTVNERISIDCMIGASLCLLSFFTLWMC